MLCDQAIICSTSMSVSPANKAIYYNTPLTDQTINGKLI